MCVNVQTQLGARATITSHESLRPQSNRNWEFKMYGNGGFGWAWFLWIGFMILMFSSVGNWGYTNRLHRRYGVAPKGALDILDERYARGEIAHDEYARMKSEIAPRQALTTGQ
jgi:putative membrane protein